MRFPTLFLFVLAGLSFVSIAKAQTDTTFTTSTYDSSTVQPAEPDHDTVYPSKRTTSLDEVIVTGSKTSLKQSQTGKIVTVIDAQTIRNNAGHTLTELLNTQAGFMLVGANNSMGTNIDNYFRGAGSGNLLVVIDGIPVTDPSQISNSFDLNSIPIEQIDHIEILKGGQSTIWGSDAVAGVIQIFTKKASVNPGSLNGNLAYGSYNTLRAGGGIDGTIKNISYKIQYNHQQSNGFSSAYDSTGKARFDKDGFSQNNLKAELGYRFSNAFQVKASGLLSNYHFGLDEGAFTDDKNYNGKNRNRLAALYLTYNQAKITWTTMGSYQDALRSITDDSTDAAGTYQHGQYRARNLNAESYVNWRFAPHMQLVGGGQYITQNSSQSYQSVSSFGPFSSKLGSDSAHTRQYSAYASYLLTDLGGFNFEAGLRYNNHSLYGNNVTYTINPSFQTSDHSKIFVNISSAYKTPSLYQLYSEYGNHNLEPEKSITYEIGMQTESDNRSTFRIAAFKRDISHLIVFFTDPNTFASVYINRDRQHDFGFELESNMVLGSRASWNNNFSYVDGEGNEDGVKVKNLYRRPNFILNSRLNIHPVSKLLLAPVFKFVGTRPKGTFDVGEDPMASYYTVGLFVSYEIRSIRIFADLQNLTNQQYFDIYGYNSKRFNLMAGLSIAL